MVTLFSVWSIVAWLFLLGLQAFALIVYIFLYWVLIWSVLLSEVHDTVDMHLLYMIIGCSWWGCWKSAKNPCLPSGLSELTSLSLVICKSLNGCRCSLIDTPFCSADAFKGLRSSWLWCRWCPSTASYRYHMAAGLELLYSSINVSLLTNGCSLLLLHLVVAWLVLRIF